MLQEAGLPYNLLHVRLGKGDQYTELFRVISPNGKDRHCGS